MRWLIVAALLAGAHRADAKGCTERSDVIGYHHCTWYGTWSREVPVPRFWMELGYFRHSYTSEPFTLGAQAMTIAPERLATTAGGVEERFLYGLDHLFYTGLELQPGWIAHVPRTPGIAPNTLDYFGMHAVVGAHVELVRLALSAELAGGFRYEDFAYCKSKSSCPYDASQTRGEVEARLRLDAFVLPQLSLGTSLGKSLIDSNDTTWTVTATIHMRAIDGMW